MKYRDHEKIVNQLEHKYQRQLATLQTKIRRIEHIITLAEDPTTAAVAHALYTDYLAEQPAHPQAAKSMRDTTEIELMIEVIIEVAEKITPHPASNRRGPPTKPP